MNEIQNDLYGLFRDKKAPVFKEVKRLSDLAFTQVKEQINDEFIDDNLKGSNPTDRSSLHNILAFHKEFKVLNQALFNEDLKNNLGFQPCEILLREYNEQINSKIDAKVK